MNWSLPSPTVDSRSSSVLSSCAFWEETKPVLGLGRRVDLIGHGCFQREDRARRERSWPKPEDSAQHPHHHIGSALLPPSSAPCGGRGCAADAATPPRNTVEHSWNTSAPMASRANKKACESRPSKVGTARFELATFRPPAGCATKLRHVPTTRRPSIARPSPADYRLRPPQPARSQAWGRRPSACYAGMSGAAPDASTSGGSFPGAPRARLPP